MSIETQEKADVCHKIHIDRILMIVSDIKELRTKIQSECQKNTRQRIDKE